jgi:hypothetical protein
MGISATTQLNCSPMRNSILGIDNSFPPLRFVPSESAKEPRNTQSEDKSRFSAWVFRQEAFDFTHFRGRQPPSRSADQLAELPRLSCAYDGSSD